MTVFNLAETMRLDGKVAIVIGGAGHLGSAICGALVGLGAGVAVVDRDVTRMRELVERLQREDRARASAHAVDLEHLEDAEGLLAEVIHEHGRADILVHAASLVGTTPLPGWTTSFEEQSLETWRRALEVNLTSVFTLVQAFFRQQRSMSGADGAASVVLVGSIYGSRGPDMSLYAGTSMGNPAAYAASKGGLAQFTRWAACVAGPRMRINCVSPGGVARQQPTSFVQRYVERTPLGRLATENDVAGAVAFLASPAASYITGHELLVDGGFSLR